MWVVGHMQHNIRDPNRDHKHGRIFRLTLKDRPLQEPVTIAGASIEKLLENLKPPIDGVRHRTRVELSAHDSEAVVAAAQKWAADFDPNDEKEAHHLLEALWPHQAHNVRNDEMLKKLQNSTVGHAKIAANTVAHFWNVVDKSDSRVVIEEEPVVKVKAPSHLKGSAAKAYVAGAEIFKRDAHCSTCHQDDGKGLPNLYPPLADSAWVTGDEERLIKLTLHGLWGKIDVNGVTYDPAKGIPPMTAFGALLDDKEVAAVLTYVRNSWGNKAEPVSHKTVKKVRSANAKRDMF